MSDSMGGIISERPGDFIGIGNDAPRGKDTTDIEAAIDNQRAGIDRLEDDARALADELLTNRSNAVRRKLREVEDQHDEADKKLSALIARRDTLTSASVGRRLVALRETLVFWH
jgi:hypothetical protein